MRKWGIFSVLFVFLLLSLVIGYYFYKKNTINLQITKLDTQLQELPELEKDIFTKCMTDKNGTAQEIAFCQENTQKQMATLAQDLTNAKRELESKNIIEVLK